MKTLRRIASLACCSFWPLAALVVLSSCTGPRVRIQEFQRASARPDDCEPFLLPVASNVAPSDVLLSEARYGETGFSIHCSEAEIKERLRQQACRTGADAIKIVVEGFPNPWTSTCYRVQAKLYKLAISPPKAPHETLVPHPELHVKLAGLPDAAPACDTAPKP